MIYIRKMATVMSLAVLLGATSVTADSTGSTGVDVTQKDGARLLKSSYNYLGSLQKYAFRADVTNTVLDDGKEFISKRTSDAKVKRPDKMRVDSKSDTVDRTVYLSNGVFTMIDNKEKYYASVKTDGGIDETLDRINKKLGIALPLSTLFYSDMAQYIHPKRVQSFGTRILGGVECNYIAFKQGKTVVHMWIENSDTPLIKAAKIVTAKSGTTDMVLKWDTTPSFSDSEFVFKAPKGASNISIKPAK